VKKGLLEQLSKHVIWKVNQQTKKSCQTLYHFR